ncbi:hypothetical protein HELRODRAFT_181242 [Helobdella robusta]|uniref:Uncharacterized protein n=1 Tax=Helobdella robusta TaxID=6412 RepID=T1FGS2_HELRO|nr:hypothetical protein HELRODRAFT_181242 [Helobdella robusta]ESN93134.1 hypothetical protein HELRODRAFT_181242 [Helobdella robusta]
MAEGIIVEVRLQKSVNQNSPDVLEFFEEHGNTLSDVQKKTTVEPHRPTQYKISASKVVYRKTFYHIGNISKTCAFNVVDHLESIYVKVLSCYPVFKRRDDKIKLDETHSSSLFRLCVDEKYAEIVERSSSWPDYVQVRNWVFNNNSKSGSTRNADVNARTCSDVKR